mgnify:CR=1 FL=1
MHNTGDQIGMFDFCELYPQLEAIGLERSIEPLKTLVADKFNPANHGDIKRWTEALSNLPKLQIQFINLDRDSVQIGSNSNIALADKAQLTDALQEFRPWRKGPFELFGIDIDTEWRSDWKWNRLKDQISPLEGRTVLDVGCGNGYHVLRMAGAGAKLVVGIDPTLLFNMQFQALQRYIQNDRCWLLPITLEEFPEPSAVFDTVFSMGVLYHRRSPIDHLAQLKKLITPGGELVLETLVIDGSVNDILIPEGRYAKMRNVWFIPSAKALEVMLKRAGYKNVRTIDVSPTTVNEQRSTDWMTFESLSDFLDPSDSSKTIEGLPAPKRAIVLAET